MWYYIFYQSTHHTIIAILRAIQYTHHLRFLQYKEPNT